jgi:hypothetical protein
MNTVSATTGGANSMVMDQLDAMMAWEDGQLNMEQTAKLFQGLIDSGLAWQLQGCYGRYAMQMIEAGWCVRR